MERRKTITVGQIEETITDIIHDREEVAKFRDEPFIGVSEREMVDELRKRLGEGWMLKREQPFKLTKEDITAVANSRFYRKTGMRLLMLWAIVVLGLMILAWTLKLMPMEVMYGLTTVASLVFVFIYAKRQRQARIELWRQIQGGGFEERK